MTTYSIYINAVYIFFHCQCQSTRHHYHRYCIELGPLVQSYSEIAIWDYAPEIVCKSLSVIMTQIQKICRIVNWIYKSLKNVKQQVLSPVFNPLVILSQPLIPLPILYLIFSVFIKWSNCNMVFEADTRQFKSVIHNVYVPINTV